jgi:hypothetical protein
VTTLAEGDAASGRGKRGDGVSWADVNLTGSKMKKIHVINSDGTNGR